jgi:hypothetical protein
VGLKRIVNLLDFLSGTLLGLELKFMGTSLTLLRKSEKRSQKVYNV